MHSVLVVSLCLTSPSIRKQERLSVFDVIFVILFNGRAVKNIETKAWIESMTGINIHQGYSIVTYFCYEAIQFHLIIVLISPMGLIVKFHSFCCVNIVQQIAIA